MFLSAQSPLVNGVDDEACVVPGDESVDVLDARGCEDISDVPVEGDIPIPSMGENAELDAGDAVLPDRPVIDGV